MEGARTHQSEWRRRWGIIGVVGFDTQVGAGADDGWSSSLPQFVSTEDQNWLGLATSIYDHFSRFTNVNIPAGATIASAYITVENKAGIDGSGVKTNLYFSDEDDPAAPIDRAEHVADPRTTAFTAWDDEDFTNDVPTNSPDIASVLQEIIDRVGWNSGQALLLLWDDDGSSANKYYGPWSYEGDTSKAVKLHVEYSA